MKDHRINITWITSTSEPKNSNPVNQVIVEYKTLYEQDVWYTLRDVVLKGENKVEVKISPWAFYTFRLILVNDIGKSGASPESGLIQSPAAGQW